MILFINYLANDKYDTKNQTKDQEEEKLINRDALKLTRISNSEMTVPDMEDQGYQ